MFTLPQIIIISGFLLLIAELILGIQTGFDLAVIGASLIIGGIGGNLLSSDTATILISAGLCLSYITFGRKLVKSKISVLTHKTNIDKLVGASGVCFRSISPDTSGMVRVKEEDWRAISDDVIFEKEKIEVIGVEGVSLKVKKQEK